MSKNEAQFYVFELKLRLTGNYKNKDKNLPEDQKKEEKRTFFDRLLKTKEHFVKKYTCKGVLKYLSSLEHINHKYTRYLIQLKNFVFNTENNEGMCLFFYANQDIQTPDVYNFITGAERSIEQQNIEGAKFVSHMVMRIIKDPMTNEERLYVALEERSHIYPSQVKKILDHVLKEWSEPYKYDERDITVYPEFEVLSSQSDTLEQMLTTGKIQGIKLVQITPENSKQDAIPFLGVRKTELALRVPRKMALSCEEQLSGIAQVIKVHKNDYSRLKVTIDLDGVRKTNEFELLDTNTPEDILQQLFCHKITLVFNKDLNINYFEVEKQIIEKVLNEVLTNEKLGFSS